LISWKISIGFNSWDADISHVLEKHFFRNIRGLCNLNAEVYSVVNSHVKYLRYWLLGRHEHEAIYISGSRDTMQEGLVSNLASNRIANHRIAEMGWNQKRLRRRVLPTGKTSFIQVNYEFCREKWNQCLNQIDVII
jgi:hypothetical protein